MGKRQLILLSIYNYKLQFYHSNLTLHASQWKRGTASSLIENYINALITEESASRCDSRTKDLTNGHNSAQRPLSFRRFSVYFGCRRMRTPSQDQESSGNDKKRGKNSQLCK